LIYRLRFNVKAKRSALQQFNVVMCMIIMHNDNVFIIRMYLLVISDNEHCEEVSDEFPWHLEAAIERQFSGESDLHEANPASAGRFVSWILIFPLTGANKCIDLTATAMYSYIIRETLLRAVEPARSFLVIVSGMANRASPPRLLRSRRGTNGGTTR